MHETIGFAVLIYSHISILVHNREDTIQNHTSLLIKILLESLKLILPSDATLPPCAPKACTIAYKLYKCSGNGINANRQTFILNSRINAYEQCIENDRHETEEAEGGS